MADTDVSQAAAAAAVDAVVDLLDVGGAGTIEIRDGVKPANPDTAATGQVLSTHALAATAFGNATQANPAVATAAAIGDATAVATSTATWFRAYSGAGTAVIDGDVSTVAAGTGDMQIDDTAIVSGGTVAINSWTFSQPTG